MKIYIIHKKSLACRINKVITLLTACNFVEDIEIITSEDSELEFMEVGDNHMLPSYFPKYTTNPERSVLHKHFRALKKISDSGSPAIILEDDVLFNPIDFDQFIVECVNMPKNLDWCFFGTGCQLKIPGQGFVKNTNPLKSKCADSMLIHHNAATKVYNDMKKNKARCAIDWDLNYRFVKHNLNVYWYEPGFITQGSENGTYPKTHIR